VQDLATVDEIKTAKNLSSSRSKIFLEKRAYEEKTSFSPEIICCLKKF